LYGRMENVTSADIMNAAQHFFVPERRTVVVLKGAQ
jgi:hypothetical protein